MNRSYQELSRNASNVRGGTGDVTASLTSRKNKEWGWRENKQGGRSNPLLPMIVGGRSMLDWSNPPNEMNVQAKLRITAPGDRFEREADDIAERVEGNGGAATHVGGPSGLKVSAGSESSNTIPEPAPQSAQMVIDRGGESLDTQTRDLMEQRIGRDFSSVRIHRDASASMAADEIGARAYTVGSHVVFGSGEYRPQSSDGRKLIAHELTHVVQQGGSVEVIQRQKKSDRPDPTVESWIGMVNTWSIALRRTPGGDTVADLPKGSYAWVIGVSGGWLKVNAPVAGKEVTGFVSQELLDYVRPAALKSYEQHLSPNAINVAAAYLILNQMEIAASEQGGSPLVSPGELAKAAVARRVLLNTGKYTVDPKTYRVSLIQRTGSKVKIDTIEDFILFVEDVERAYPGASITEVVSEIREIWFADSNWELLVSSHGITNGKPGKVGFEDIETEPNPIAKKYNMKDLAPGIDPTTGAAPKKTVSTRYGAVEISHVIAGIDAAMSPMPSSYPQSLLENKGHDDDDAKLGASPNGVG